MAAIFALIAQGTVADESTITVTPRVDAAAVLHNPDMGWVLYENYPLDPRPGGSSTLVTLPGEDFAGVDHVALMFSWADIETAEGRYDFTKADHAYDYWHRRGKQIQLRLSTESLLWWGNLDPPAGLGIPPYVLARIPAERKQTRQCEGLSYAVVDARDPVYLDRLEKFLAAVADHFRGERAVTLIDLRGFGLWGEWHSGYRYATLEDRRAALKGVIDRYAAAFPHNDLALSYSYDPDSPKALWDGPTDLYDPAFTKTYNDYLRYSAFDYALAKPNVTFRRDGAGGAVHSNERRLNDEAFRTLAKGPMASEFLDGYARSKQGRPGWVEWKVDDALSLHPNYVNLLGWQGADALAFLRERRNPIDKGLRRMGYRLVPTKVTYPRRVRNGQPFAVESEWTNEGAGRAMRDYHLRLSLCDPKGATAATCDAGAIETSRWVEGSRYKVSKAVTFTGVTEGGEFELRMSVHDPKTGRTIALPLAGSRADGPYPLGTLRCDP